MVINELAFEEFDAYLARKLKENDYFIFSHSALAVIRRLLSLIELQPRKLMCCNLKQLVLNACEAIVADTTNSKAT